jgi:hypothetical protein
MVGRRHYDVLHANKPHNQISNPSDLDPDLNPYNFITVLSPRRVWTPIKNTTLQHFGQGSATIRVASAETITVVLHPYLNVRRATSFLLLPGVFGPSLLPKLLLYESHILANHIST